MHRDFKSNNVMLVPQPEAGRRAPSSPTSAWRVRAGDDAAGRDTPSTMTGEILGTPDYMAPEQVEGGEVTPATDVYALGLVMYEMVTGARPFAAATPLAAAVRRLSEPPPSAARAGARSGSVVGVGHPALPGAAAAQIASARRRRRQGAGRAGTAPRSGTNGAW